MIQISETAARKIKSLMAKQGISEGGLRVGVKGGGCSGLSEDAIKAAIADYRKKQGLDKDTQPADTHAQPSA
jgi:Fe-S cluster assembly iron-binding protein IscA